MSNFISFFLLESVSFILSESFIRINILHSFAHFYCEKLLESVLLNPCYKNIIFSQHTNFKDQFRHMWFFFLKKKRNARWPCKTKTRLKIYEAFFHKFKFLLTFQQKRKSCLCNHTMSVSSILKLQWNTAISVDDLHHSFYFIKELWCIIRKRIDLFIRDSVFFFFIFIVKLHASLCMCVSAI